MPVLRAEWDRGGALLFAPDVESDCRRMPVLRAEVDTGGALLFAPDVEPHCRRMPVLRKKLERFHFNFANVEPQCWRMPVLRERATRGKTEPTDMPIREKKHRLPEEAYWGAKRISITACIADRGRVFTRPEVVAPFVELLRHWTQEKNCYVSIYCFMPDHLHVIIGGNDHTSRPKEAMDEFKESTSRWFLENMPDAHWQKDYHDHLIRISDDWRNHVRYILRNPVRGALCEFPLEYPYLGSIGVEIADVLGEL